MIETSLDLPRKPLVILGNPWQSLAIFRNFRKMFGNISLAHRQLLENLQKSLVDGQIFRKLPKT